MGDKKSISCGLYNDLAKKIHYASKYTTNTVIQARILNKFAIIKEIYKSEIISITPYPNVYFKFDVLVFVLSPRLWSELGRIHDYTVLTLSIDIEPVSGRKVFKIQIKICPEGKTNTKKLCSGDLTSDININDIGPTEAA